jgi:hypothetical protein
MNLFGLENQKNFLVLFIGNTGKENFGPSATVRTLLIAQGTVD